MALRLNKTSKIVFAISIVILSGALGFLLWRVNQVDTTAPEESEAGENWCNCCDHPKSGGSIPECGGSNNTPCSCTYAADQCNNDDGSTMSQCTVSECTEGSDCSEHCVWPQVNYCDRVENGVCICKSPPNNCGTSTPCEINCPDGYSECSSGAGCEPREQKCTCPDCDNDYYVQIKCKQDTVAPVCGDGKKDSTEACDYKASPTGCKSGYTCTNKCKCVATATCGDGKVDSGEDCDPKASPTGCNTGSTCLSDCSCSAVIEDTCGDGTLDSGEECESGDPSGNSCAWADCNQSTCLCKALSITKSVVESCIDEGTDNPKALLSYTITVANSGTEDRTVTKIEDVLDSKLSTASIVPTGITSPGVYSSGKILWDYQTTNLIVKGGETKRYTYKVEIDKDNFGEYSNTVTLTRSTGVTSVASSNIVADCVITIPQTGIFDSTLGRILAGVTLLIIGSIVYNIPNRVLVVKRKDRINKYRVRFEKKVANR